MTMTNSERMLAAIERQDLEEANYYYDKVLLEDDPSIQLELAFYLESIGFLDKAEQLYLRLCDDYPEVIIHLAQIAAENGDIDQAFLYLDAISQDSPDYVSALLTMADLYDMEGLTDVARDKLILANEFSQDPIVIFALAEVNFNLENYQDALSGYAQLDNREILSQTGVSTYQRIGAAYAAMGKFEAATEFLEKANEISFDPQTAFELASLLFEEEDYAKARLYLKQIDTLNPDFDGYEYLYALTLHAEHKVKEALVMLQQGLSKNPFNSKLLLNASKFAYELHDNDRAENYLLKALEVAEDREDVLIALTTLYLEWERYDDVISFVENDLENPLLLWNIAKAYYELDNLEQSLPIYEDIAQNLAENPEFLQDYIFILREIGHSKKSQEWIKKYLKLVPDDIIMLGLLEEE